MKFGSFSEIKQQISRLPVAKQFTPNLGGYEDKDSIGLMIEMPKGEDGEVKNNCFYMSKHYRLVQHKEAFKPIIDAIGKSKMEDVDVNIWTSRSGGQAFMDVAIIGAKDSCRIGFRCANSIDGSRALGYTFEADSVKRDIVLIGYRQVCSNGLKIRVPITEAEFVKEEELVRIQKLFQTRTKVRHFSTECDKGLMMVKFACEALTLFREPVNRIIERGEEIKLTDDQAKEIIKRYVANRYKESILRQFSHHEHHTVWGLYNAITHTGKAYHATTEQKLVDEAADMLHDLTINPKLALVKTVGK